MKNFFVKNKYLIVGILTALIIPTSASALIQGLPINQGGTSQTTANAAFNALAPAQTSNSGKYLTTDGTNTSWGTVSAGGVTSVSNSDGTLTISPTTGSVVSSLNLAHANTWTGAQTFNSSAPTFGTMTANSVLFAGTSGVLSQDNNNFYIQNSATTPETLALNTNVALSVNTGGDFTGTDAVNIYGQYDAFLPNSAITNSLSGLNTDGAVPGYTSSSTRGTGASPVELQTGDMVGGYFGFGTQGASSPTYQNLGGMAVTTVGTTVNNLGGQLNFYTKANNGSLANNMIITNSGNLLLPNAGTSFFEVVSDQSVTQTFWGIQLAGMTQTVPTSYTAARAGISRSDYHVVIPMVAPAASGLAILGVGSQTANYFEITSNANKTTTHGDIFWVTSAGVTNLTSMVASGTITGASGNVVIGNGTIQTLATATNATFNVTNSSGATTESVSQYQYNSSTTNFLRTAFYGSFSQILTTGANYSSVLFANAPITTFTSGTHPWLANVVVKPIGTVTNAGATVTNTASLFIDGAGTGGTNNYALYVNGGTSSLLGVSLHQGYGVGINTLTATANTITTSQSTIRCDATSGAQTDTLPTAASAFNATNNQGQIFTIKKIDSSANSCTLKGNGSENIDGSNTKAITLQYNDYQVQSNGTSWDILQ